MSFRSSIWLKAQTRELRKARCCSSSSLMRSTSPVTSGTGLGVAAISCTRFLSFTFYCSAFTALKDLTGLNCLVGIQAPETEILVAEVVGIRQTDGNRPARAIAIFTEHERCR